MINIDKKVNIPICIISLAAMEPIHESTNNVSTSLAVEGSTNMQLTSSNTEDVNLSHDDDTVNLKNQTQVNVEEKDGDRRSIGVSPIKKWRVISQLMYPEFQLSDPSICSTSTNWEFDDKSSANEVTWEVQMYEGIDSETKTNIPIFYIHSFNECLYLIPGYAGDFMDKISEEMRLWPNLEYPVFESNVINVEKKVARYKLIQSYMKK